MLAATFALAAFGLYMIAPVNKSVNHSKTITSMCEVQGRVAHDVILFMVTQLWKINSLVVKSVLQTAERATKSDTKKKVKKALKPSVECLNYSKCC